ncbi:MAG: cytochrome c biogenesis protein CcsA [Tannerella sp.]|jgi:cytochrome c-type biogenesis protein CcsB|nr:cytochrome c biogenesis protein CcsA [Tannerella sp.]
MEQLEKIMSSYVTMVVLLVLYAVGLATATFVEKASGDAMLAKVLIYYSPWFFLLQFLLVVNFLLVVKNHHLLKSKRIGFLILHFSFIIILTGAAITHFFSWEGVLHLREGEVSNQIIIRNNHENTVYTLPFQVELEKFTLTRYPGSMSPSSYESNLLVHVDNEVRKERVYMNNVMNVKGYRFFQASFDTDERGTVLSVSKDVAGRNVTYAGYLLLAAGFILCLVGKNGRLRIVSRQLKELKNPSKLFIIIMLCYAPSWVSAETKPSPMLDAVQKYAIPAAHAERFGALPLQSMNGRIIPVNTFSSEVLRKLHKDTKIGSLNPDQFLLSLLTLPEMWMQAPFITFSDREIAGHYGLTPGHCAYIELFNPDGSYKLEDRVEEAYQKMPAQRNSFDKDIIKLDEQVHIFSQLSYSQLINIFPKPNDPNQKWYAPGDDLSGFQGQDSVFVTTVFYGYLAEVQDALKSNDWTAADKMLEMISTYQYAKNNIAGLDTKKINTELKYNRMNPFRWCKTGYLSLGGCLLIFSFILFYKEKRWAKWMIRFLGILVLIVFHYHMLGMGLRWKIGGYAPWSNSYETMVYVAWATVFAGLLFMRRSPMTFALATLFAGIILFVSSLNWMDPQINPLVPVLKSPWLMFHVAILMAAYGFFGVSFLIGITNLVMMGCVGKKKQTAYVQSFRELSLINEMTLIIGLTLMTVGTFMGAVWANESWGRYWGWDPKETWALITIVVYVLVTHLHLVRKWYNLWLFNLCTVISFFSVLMTYFGVNYFLSGMHSYGQNENIQHVFAYLFAAAMGVVILAIFARKGRKILL